MDPSQRSETIRTRFIVVSDTHGADFSAGILAQQHADVVIHCGDLSEESKLEEFRACLRMLKALDAPMKLVIAGNHDFTLDLPTFAKKVADVDPPLDPDLVKKIYGDYGEARQLFDDAKSDGIFFLDEGNHTYNLQNGATLKIFASPYTPSTGDWGFGYHPKEPHQFSMAEGTDLVITHGPPRGIMDMTDDKRRAGCPSLFAAIAQSRPKLHCFGHIHEGWGAKLVTWRDNDRQPTEEETDPPSHFTAIDNDRSVVIEKLQSFKLTRFDSAEIREEKRRRIDLHRQKQCCVTSHGCDDAHPLQVGVQTLFVNAAIEGTEEGLQVPWIVDLELNRIEEN